MDQVIFVDMGNGRQLVQGQILFKVVVNVAPDQIALPADLVSRLRGGDSQVILTLEP